MFLTSRFWYINKDIHRFQNLGNEVLRILCWKQILDEMNKSLRSAHSTAYSTAIQMENLYNFIFTSEIEAAVLKRRLTLSLGGTIRWPGVPSWIQWSEQSTSSALFPGCECHVTGYLTCLSRMKTCILQLGAKETLHPQAVCQQDVSFSGTVRTNVADKSVYIN